MPLPSPTPRPRPPSPAPLQVYTRSAMEAVLEADVGTMASAMAELVLHHDEETTRQCLELLGLDSSAMAQVCVGVWGVCCAPCSCTVRSWAT